MARAAKISRGWQLGFETVQREHHDEIELDLAGRIPADLKGVHYRIGGARHDIYGDRSRHWFEGDGMVQAFRFDAGRIFYRSRFVSTAKKQDEDAAERRLYTGFRTPAAGGPVSRLRRSMSPRKNPANTNIVLHAGDLFALCEAGQPYRLDPVSLETLGGDDLGAIPPGETFIAHPKLDIATGELWNIGFRAAPGVRVSLYRRDSHGRTNAIARLPMPFPTFAHDFAVTPTKAVIIASPLVVSRFGLRNLVAIAGGKTIFDMARWRPELGTVMIVVDRVSGKARLCRTDAFLLSHTINAFDDGDDVVVDACVYPDADFVMRLFSGFMEGTWSAIKQGRPERIRIAREGTVDREEIADIAFDFPRVTPRSWQRPTQCVFGLTGYLGGPAILNLATGEVSMKPLELHQFAGEPVPVPKSEATSDADAWLLVPILDSRARRSELWILDGANIGGDAVAQIRLPTVVPFDFHGSWMSAGHVSYSLP